MRIRNIKKMVLSLLLTVMVIMGYVSYMQIDVSAVYTPGINSRSFYSEGFNVIYRGKNVRVFYSCYIRDDGGIHLSDCNLIYNNDIYASFEDIPISGTGVYKDSTSGGQLLVPRTVYDPIRGKRYTVTHIGCGTFAGDQCIGEVYINKNIKSIELDAFATCNNMTQVTFEQGSALSHIEQGALYSKGLKYCVLPPSVKTFGRGAFYDNDETIVINNSEQYSALRNAGFKGRIQIGKGGIVVKCATDVRGNIDNNGFFFIRNMQTGKYMTITSEGANCSSIMETPFTGDAWQLFGLNNNRIYSHHILNIQGRYKALDLRNGRTDVYTKIQLYPQHDFKDSINGAAQMFKLLRQQCSDGTVTYRMVAEKYNCQKYITGGGYSGLYIDTLKSGNSQLWVFEQIVSWS